MPRELTMLIYPWDIQAGGPGKVLDELAGLGIDRVQIATAYHSAEVIAPRRLVFAAMTKPEYVKRWHLQGPASAGPWALDVR